MKRFTAPAPRAEGDGLRFGDPFFAALVVAFGVDDPFLAMLGQASSNEHVVFVTRAVL